MPAIAVLAHVLTAPTPTPAPGSGASTAGPSCGLPTEIVNLGDQIIGWEKGILALTLFAAAFGCLIAMAVGKWFNWRHVSEAAGIGLVVTLCIAAGAGLLGGILALFLGNLAC